ncbi:DUF5947 family protein [soil metagenome]
MSGLARFTGTDTRQDEEASPLRRFAQPRPRPAAGEVCELCAQPVDDRHGHVVDTERRSLLCACRSCYLLFARPGAGQGRYRAVGERYLRVEPFALSPLQWSALQIPVGMAFFLVNSHLGRTVAFYPSPAGATESLLELDAWEDIVGANPALADLEPDAEAALVRSGDVTTSCHIVPVDRCYELVGALRLHWRGFDGGQEVHERIDAFFEDVQARSRPVAGRPG